MLCMIKYMEIILSLNMKMEKVNYLIHSDSCVFCVMDGIVVIYLLQCK